MKKNNFQKRKIFNSNKGFTPTPIFKKIGVSSLERGFTLIETMVGVLILTVALVSLLSLTSRSIFAARYSRNETTANYLLQEVVDYMRNQRDTIVFYQNPGTGWPVFLSNFGYPSGACFSVDGCYFNVNKTILSINTCSQAPTFGSSKCPVLNYDPNATDGNFYNYGLSGNSSNFKRQINFELNPSQDELYVTVKIEWLNGSLTRSKTLKISLLNWL